MTSYANTTIPLAVVTATAAVTVAAASAITTTTAAAAATDSKEVSATDQQLASSNLLMQGHQHQHQHYHHHSPHHQQHYQQQFDVAMQQVDKLQQQQKSKQNPAYDNYDYDDSLSDEREKGDSTPENLKKIDNIIEQQQQQLNINTTASAATAVAEKEMNTAMADNCNSLTTDASAIDMDDNSLTITADSSPNTNAKNAMPLTPNKQSLSFTIDNFNDKDCNPAAKAAKYKNMMERFQNRHRRGASLSKIENVEVKANARPASASATRTSNASPVLTTMRGSSSASAHSANQTDAEKMSISRTDADGNAKVKMRVRNHSTSRVQDASKRHSWSPRSSTQELSTHMPNAAATTKTHNKSTVSGSSARFTPRSTAMQMALQNVDFMCAQPPLADLKHLQLGSDIASETGTYTLDGDLYTEEQKNHMNIETGKALSAAAQQRPRNLNLKKIAATAAVTTAAAAIAAAADTKIPVHISSAGNKTCSNVLEVNYYHDDTLEPPQQQQQQQPLKQLKHMPPISPHHINGLSNASDQQKDLQQQQQQQRPTARLKPIVNTQCKPANAQLAYSTDLHKGARLKTSSDMILDQSTLAFFEAIRTRLLGADVIKRSSPAPVEKERDAGCFTSVTTSGVLAKQRTLDACPLRNRRSSLSTSQIDSSDYISSETILKNSIASETQSIPSAHLDSPPDTPTTPLTELSDTAILKTAKTKKDWIQEWARNARARSLASEEKKTRQATKLEQEGLMTRSYTCATSDGICELQPQPMTVSSCCGCVDINDELSCKTATAPKSPSKIPSPLHSMGRARSASRMRQAMPQYEEDIYLQNTAAVLKSLQESLTRMNVLKSPTHSMATSTPRASSAHVYNSRSPQHSIDSPIGGNYQHYNAQYQPQQQRNSPLHRRNIAATPHYQLMTSSINEQQLQLLTSGEYLAKQMRRRKNSFDGNMENRSPRRNYDDVQQQPTSAQDATLSPLRRSSSFSAKVQALPKARAARPNFQNIYTPPAARHNALSVTQAMKKSASSNNFAQPYSDYDDNLEYYINDEDDLCDESYSSDCDAKDEYYQHYDDAAYDDNDDDDMIAQQLQQQQQQQQQLTAQPTNSGNDATVPLSNTRYNKALLIRIERSKQRIAGKVSSAPTARTNVSATVAGLAACPNTPELPRRTMKSATRAAAPRQSVPRDTSLSRLANQVPSSLASAKKQLLQTAAAATAASNNSNSNSNRNQRVQSKYLNFSKNAKNTMSYPTAHANNALRRSDVKSSGGSGGGNALKVNSDAMKRSPSSSSMGVTRGDPMRISNRSNKSVASSLGINANSYAGNNSRASSAARRDASVSKQKEVEMAMWKRRSKYDPMKAAAEDRRKKEEAKRLTTNRNDIETTCERPSRSTFRRGYEYYQ